METRSPDHPWNWGEQNTICHSSPSWETAAWVSNSHTNSPHLKSPGACFPEFSLCEKRSRTCKSNSLQLEVTHSYKAKCTLQKNSSQRHGLRWWNHLCQSERAWRPRAPVSPTGTRSQWSDVRVRCSSTDQLDSARGTSRVAGEAPVLPAVPGSQRDEACQGSLPQSFSSSSGSPKVGPALDQMLEEPLSKQEKARAYSACTDSGFRDSWWGLLRCAGGRGQGGSWLHHLTCCTPRCEDLVGTPWTVPS